MVNLKARKWPINQLLQLKSKEKKSVLGFPCIYASYFVLLVSYLQCAYLRFDEVIEEKKEAKGYLK